jgi:hypothetical protein
MNISMHQMQIVLTDTYGQLHELDVEYSYNWKMKAIISYNLSNNIKGIGLPLFLPNERARFMHEIHQHAAICLDPKVLDKILS